MLRGNRDLRYLFLAEIVSYMGDWFATVAFLGVVQDASDSKVLVTLVLVCQSFPTFLLGPVAGSAADRFDRRKIVIVVSIGQTIAALGLVMVTESTLWLGYVSLALIAALASFVTPATQAAIPNLARDPDELHVANTFGGALWGAMLGIGAGLGGLFAGVFGRRAAFVADAVSFALAALFIFLIRKAMQERGHHATRARIRPMADLREAIAYARRDRPVLALMGSKFTFAIAAGAVGILSVLVRDDLGGGDPGVGLLYAARGLGAAIGPIIAMRFIGRRLDKIVLLCGAAGLIYGAGYLGVSRAPDLVIASILLVVAHMGGGAQWTMSSYGLQVRVPDAVRGRILAGDTALVTMMIAVSTLSSGVVADHIGARATLALYAGIAVLTGTVYLLVTRGIRRGLREEVAAQSTTELTAAERLAAR
jgi:MFS family permease